MTRRSIGIALKLEICHVNHGSVKQNQNSEHCTALIQKNRVAYLRVDCVWILVVLQLFKPCLQCFVTGFEWHLG